MSYTCNRCGRLIIFRWWFKDRVTGEIVRRRRPIPIHLDGGGCGERG